MTPRTSSRENSAGNICGTKLRVLGRALPYARRSFAYRLTPWLLRNWNWSCKLSHRNRFRFQEGASRGMLGWGLGRFIPNDALTLLIQQLWSCLLRNNPGGSWNGKASEPWMLLKSFLWLHWTLSDPVNKNAGKRGETDGKMV